MIRLAHLVAAVAVSAVGFGTFALLMSDDLPRTHHKVDVRMPALSPVAQAGARVFASKCASCHGQNGAGSEGGPPLIHRIYEPGYHGDRAFVLAAKYGVPAHHWRFGSMPPVQGITDRQLVAVTRYVREVQQANGIPPVKRKERRDPPGEKGVIAVSNKRR